MLLLFGVTLIFTVGSSSAATVNQTANNTNVSATQTVTNTATTTVKQVSTTNLNCTNNTDGVVVNNLTIAQLKNGISRVEAFYAKDHRLPNYVSYGSRHVLIATFEKNIASQGLKLVLPKIATSSNTSLATMNDIMRSADKYGYSHAYHDAADLERYGCGDCWAMSDYLFQKMKAANIDVRIVQYVTAYSSRHIIHTNYGRW